MVIGFATWVMLSIYAGMSKNLPKTYAELNDFHHQKQLLKNDFDWKTLFEAENARKIKARRVAPLNAEDATKLQSILHRLAVKEKICVDLLNRPSFASLWEEAIQNTPKHLQNWLINFSHETIDFPKTFVEFVDLVKKSFAKNCSLETAWILLQNFKQKDLSLLDYTERFCQLALSANALNDVQPILYCQGLNAENQLLLINTWYSVDLNEEILAVSSAVKNAIPFSQPRQNNARISRWGPSHENNKNARPTPNASNDAKFSPSLVSTTNANKDPTSSYLFFILLSLKHYKNGKWENFKKHALINSGSEKNYTSATFAKEFSLKLLPGPSVHLACLGKLATSYLLAKPLTFFSKDIKFTSEFSVLKDLEFPIILG